MTGVIVCLALAASFYGLGAWGLRNVHDLVPVTLSEERRAKDVRSMRRGAKSCYVVAVLFTFMGVLSLVSEVGGA